LHWPRLFDRLFAGAPANERVATRVHFGASPESTWNGILFYEEVPGRPPFPLSIFMPIPVRTEGAKTSAGATVRCIYTRGDLTKRITSIKAPRCIQFEVLDQRLGIERCAVARGGSYEIAPSGTGADVLLYTNYTAYLHPRSLWRPLEKLVVHQLHSHVLNGMRVAICPAAAALAPATTAQSTH
jgi:hypothetical protein